jgi:hypothetical protein
MVNIKKNKILDNLQAEKFRFDECCEREESKMPSTISAFAKGCIAID